MEQRKVRFLVLEPEGITVHGLTEAVQVLRSHAWSEVILTSDYREACNKLFAGQVDGLILLRPEGADWKPIEQALFQWVSVHPEEVYVLLLAELPTYREASWATEWRKNIWLYNGFHDLGSKFFSFGEMVRSKVK